MKKGKVVLVGTGFVGMSMAYSMLNRGGVSELVLIDIDKDKTIGEQMDLSHGLPFAPQKMMLYFTIGFRFIPAGAGNTR